jgi:hypothetical protein
MLVRIQSWKECSEAKIGRSRVTDVDRECGELSVGRNKKTLDSERRNQELWTGG